MTGQWLVRYCLERIGGEEGLKRLKSLYESGMPIKDLMREFNLSSPQCIYVLIKERRRRYKGKGKITPEIAEKIMELRRAGYSIPAIAGELGISIGSVHRVLKMRSEEGSA